MKQARPVFVLSLLLTVAALCALGWSDEPLSPPLTPTTDDSASTSGPAWQRAITLDLGKGVTLKLLSIIKGKFEMGSPKSEKGHQDNEGSAHTVIISRPYYLGMYPVTQAQFAAVLGRNPSSFKGEKTGDNPVETVTFDEAEEFCAKLAALTGRPVRLPTEAEWEFACRATSSDRFCFGDSEKELADYAWFAANSGGATHPCGQKAHNPWGLYDIYGNVWQWCSDYYAEVYPDGEATDPEGPATGRYRVVRGGSWSTAADLCRSASRGINDPKNKHNQLGFRVALDDPTLPPRATSKPASRPTTKPVRTGRTAPVN
jgi:formylglycine-generating enzyme required for sulfatase activity